MSYHLGRLLTKYQHDVETHACPPMCDPAFEGIRIAALPAELPVGDLSFLGSGLVVRPLDSRTVDEAHFLTLLQASARGVPVRSSLWNLLKKRIRTTGMQNPNDFFLFLCCGSDGLQ